MSKRREDAAHPSEPLPEEETHRRYGLFATLAILTIMGIAVWFIVNQNTTD